MIRNFAARQIRVWWKDRRVLSSRACLEENIVNYAKSRNEKRVVRYLNKINGVLDIDTLFAVADMWKLSGNATMFQESVRTIATHPQSDRNTVKIVKYYGSLCHMWRNEHNSPKIRKQIHYTIKELVEFVSRDVHSKKAWSEICRSVDHAVAVFDRVRGRDKIVHSILSNLLIAKEPITGSYLGNRALSTIQRYHSRHNPNLYDAFERLNFTERLRRENRIVSRAELLSAINSQVECAISTPHTYSDEFSSFTSKHETFGLSQYVKSLAALLERVHTKRWRDPSLEQYMDLKEQIWNALLGDLEILLCRSDVTRNRSPVMSAFELSLTACAVCRDTDRAMHILKILTSSKAPISNMIKTKCIDVCVWDRHGHVMSRDILDKIDRHNKSVAVEDNAEMDRVKHRVIWNDSERELRLHFLEAKRGKKVDVKTWLLELENLEKRAGASHADVQRTLNLALHGFRKNKDWSSMLELLLYQSRRGMMLTHHTIAECMNLHLLSRHYVPDNEIWDNSVSAPFLEDIRDVVLSNGMKFSKREHILALNICRLSGRSDMAQEHFDEIASTFCEINRGPLHDYILSLRDPYVTAEEINNRIQDAIETWTCNEKSIGIDASTRAHAIFALGTKFVHLPEQEDSKVHRLLTSPSISYFERGIETTTKHDRLHHSKLCTNALQLCRKAKYEHEFASLVVDAMKDKGITYTSADINALMEMAAARGDGDNLYFLWNEVLEREDLSPHPFQLDAIVRFESASKPVDELEEMILSYVFVERRAREYQSCHTHSSNFEVREYFRTPTLKQHRYSKKYNIRAPMRSLDFIQDLAADSTSNSTSETESYSHVASRIRAMKFERLVDLAGGIQNLRGSNGGGEEEDYLL